MRVVLVSSPGGSPPHWSDAHALALANELVARGAGVEWLRVADAAEPAAELAPLTTRAIAAPRRAALHRVGAGMQHLALERTLARSLRQRHADAVVHLGLGAGGSPNVTWLAERMGSRAFAVVRSAEVLCQRGDLVDAGGGSCRRFDDAATCGRCCARSWWARPHPHEFLNRWDLLVGGLLVAEAVFVASADEAEQLASVGVPRHRLAVDLATDAIARRVAGA